ncbi:hypothetical protein PoB_000962400 [Plakobranchus ocellatus]|uniref:Uncharacterized protein n=1 Tax=Plakobranchus ocellatus TaxID=259542 RepID=A0AAV3YLW4_9GAST|nr:hypothetical protein PoB_000962400 [Plakobranchus ocellatus]
MWHGLCRTINATSYSPWCLGDTSLPRTTTDRCHPSLASSIIRHERDRECLGHSRPSHTRDESCSSEQGSINSKLNQRLENHPTRSNFQYRQLYAAQMLSLLQKSNRGEITILTTPKVTNRDVEQLQS